MNLQQCISLTLFVMISCTLTAQKVDTKISWLTEIPDAADNIIYNPQQKLTIADFKGTPNSASDAVAITSSGFMFKAGYHAQNGKATLAIAVYCNFTKSESWMKERGKTAYILAHEQRHFDISYISTLLFIKKLQQARFQQDDYLEQLKTIHAAAVQQMKELQRQYDEETNNGINTIQQEEWNKKIAEKLSDAVKNVTL